MLEAYEKLLHHLAPWGLMVLHNACKTCGFFNSHC